MGTNRVEDEYYDIFFIKCKHTARLDLESAEWCPECNDWIDGDLVGDLTLRLKADSTIEVSGGGYVEQSGEAA